MKNILIVEDLAETQKWLSKIAGEAFPGAVVDLADSMRSGLAAAARSNYDLALIDLGLPDGSGIEVMRNLRLLHPETLCVVTTVMGDDAHIVAALSAGAQGYLLKEQPAELIAHQLTQLAHGIPALSPVIARRIITHFRLTGPAADTSDDITAREKEVLALISRGLRNIDVARQLSITENTVAGHIKSIYRKLGISSRAEAAWHAARMGLNPGQTAAEE